jgi:hypothetical protein
MIDEDDCGAIGGMKIGRGNRSTRNKPAPAPLCYQYINITFKDACNIGARGSVVGWGTMLQAGSIPYEVIAFFNWPNPSSRTTALGSTQPLVEMSARNLSGDKGRPARKADRLTLICEPIVKKMWEPWRLKILWAFTACYRDSFTNHILSPMTSICH